MKNLTAFCAAFCLYANVSAASDFAAGAKAYDGGSYAEAYATWHALAREGDRRAQIAIANMYRFGEGRAVDLVEAARWYRRAAAAGDAIAQLNYAELLEHGAGVARDREAALDWYERAAAQGNDWATAQRDRLRTAFKRAGRPPPGSR